MDGLIYSTISKFLMFVYYLIFARIIISYIVKDTSNKFVQLLYEVTEPILAPFRFMLEKLNLLGRFDFSPILAFLFINFLQRMLYAAMF